MRKYVIIVFLVLSSFAQALDFEARISGGFGAASGSFVDAVEDRYASLGGASLSDPGSSRLGIEPLCGGGLGLVWGGKARLSFSAGVEYGFWGFSLIGERAGGGDFASLRLSCGALSLGAELRWLPAPHVELSAGPLLGVVVSDYRIVERISGTKSLALIQPTALERSFLAGGLGLAYLSEIGAGKLALGLRGELGLSPLAMAEGALGDELALPWRALFFARYSLVKRGGAK